MTFSCSILWHARSGHDEGPSCIFRGTTKNYAQHTDVLGKQRMCNLSPLCNPSGPRKGHDAPETIQYVPRQPAMFGEQSYGELALFVEQARLQGAGPV